jgi:hypothetical protein
MKSQNTSIGDIQTKIVQDLSYNFSVKYNKLFDFHTVFDNYRQGAGLRIKRDIFLLIKELYDYYKIEIKVKNNRILSKHLVGLDTNLTMPWYCDYYKGLANDYNIISNSVYLFGQQDAFLLKLYNGDLDLWLDSCK